MDHHVESISLDRLDKKLWRFKDQEPKRVELAVLDFLRSEGWNGYFTEHFAFDETIFMMMCWGDHSKIGTTKWLDIPSASRLFSRASDGFNVDEKKVNFSRHTLLENAKRFNESDIPKIIDLWSQKERFKAKFIGTSYLKYRHASELKSEEILGYFRACGGREYFLDLIDRRFPEGFQNLSKKAREVTEEVRKITNTPGDFSTLFDSCMKFWEILGIAYSDRELSYKSIDRFCSNVRKKEPRELAEQVAAIAEEIVDFRIKQLKIYSPPSAILDLQIWREGEVASVEVKAPKDRLSQHQTDQLTRDAQSGYKSWVINVIEA